MLSVDDQKHRLGFRRFTPLDRGPFDPESYRRLHRDVRLSGMDPVRHYAERGLCEGRIAGGSAALDAHLSRLFAGSGAAVLDHEGFDTRGGWVRVGGEGASVTLALDRSLGPGWLRVDLPIGGATRASVEFRCGEARVARGGFRSARRRTVRLPGRADIVVLRFTPSMSVFRLKEPRFVAVSWGVGTADALGTLLRRWRETARRPLAATLVRLRPRRVRRRAAARARAGAYDRWIAHHDDDPALDRDGFAAAVAALPARPLISVLMPVYETDADHLDAAIRSVVEQIYPAWELCIADDASPSPRVRGQLDAWAARDRRIRIVHRETNGHIAAATNSAFALATGEWIALLDHDDLLRPHALAVVADEIAAHPEAELIYSDEDKIDAGGTRRFDPYFKPDWSPDLMRAQNYLNHLTVLRARTVRAVGGWRRGFEGSQDYDLNLRITEQVAAERIRHIPKVLYHWRAGAGSTAADPGEKSYAVEAAERALGEHLARTGLDGAVGLIPGLPYFRTRLRRPDPAPLVSLVIPTRDQAEILTVCLSSILERTNYRTLEVIAIDNGSREPETARLLAEVGRDPRVRVLRDDRPFNFSALNNRAVAEARGTIVGLLNNDIEAVAPDWLDEMVSQAVRPEIGCVGAKLLYPDGRVQHGGVILGVGGVAGHAHKYFPAASPGYFGRLGVAQNLSAVTAACLVVRKSVYEEVGGLDTSELAIAFNDVDFCLKVRARGYLNLWTPFATLIHHESASRGSEDTPDKKARFDREAATMRDRWGPELANDPYYSPNLSLTREDFSFREDE